MGALQSRAEPPPTRGGATVLRDGGASEACVGSATAEGGEGATDKRVRRFRGERVHHEGN
ncbi:hypothetical protein B7486_01125 [cyanobacterium TDX16]|nr:hypothetical protein B7486_01125 [cyanobacterium TDX16]